MEAVPPNIEPGSIAIVGLAGRFPGARNPDELWSLLRAGKEATQWLSAQELRAAGVSESDIADPDYVRASLVLPDMEMFDADFFGFSKRDAAVLDPQHRHFLECAWEALEDAGHMPENFKGAIGVFGGCGMQAYLPYNLMTNPQLVKSMGLFLLRHTGNDKDFLCSRVSYLLNLKGPSIGVQTACSTSLVAVHMAAQSLLSGECDMALAGAASIELPHRQGYRYAEGEIMSPDGHCRAFDDDAKGTLFGSGAGIVVLRRLEDAIRDRDNIYAVIRGSAVNNDGSQKAGYLAPSVDGQAAAAAEALAVAGVEPGTVSYIEAHGTGTPVGDPIELAALSQAYGDGGRGFCGIGSLKTNIGHLDTAAGVASLIKVSLALRHGVLPASLNYSKPNSRIDMAATPFYVAHQQMPWPRGAVPRRAAVNSLGVGGTNAHVIVEEPPLIASAAPAKDDWQVVTLSARTPASLEQLKLKWRDWADAPPPGATLADAAFTSQVGRRAFDHRCAVVARDLAGLRDALTAKTHALCVQGQSAQQAPGVALMFPGGGAHYAGAGRALLVHPAFAGAVDECFACMPPEAPADLRTRMFDTDPSDAAAASTLERPSYALPALFTLEYAIAKLWESWGVVPTAVIGHSAGEYAAACIAGVMSLRDALSIVVLRGHLFEEVPLGGMLSVDLAEPELREAMSGLDLDIAAINARDLCIASGPLQSISRLEKRLAEKGIEGRRLHINVAAHSRLLDGVLEAFRERVSRITLNPPAIPFVSNLTGTWADAQTLVDPEYWVKHLRNPVRFSDGVRTLLDMPDIVLLEAGPGQGLCALARQNAPAPGRAILPSTSKAQEPNADLAQMLAGAGALWTRGLAPKWEATRSAAPARRISIPTYAFEKQRHWIEPGVMHAEPAQAAVAADASSLQRIASLDDWFMTPRWRVASLAAAPAQASRWLVFGNRSRLTQEVVAQAAAAGGTVTLARPGESFARLPDGSFTMDPADAGHYGQLLNALELAGALPDRVVHLWALDTMHRAGSARIAGQALAFDSLVHFARALQHQDVDAPMQLTIVTAGSQSVSGEAVPHPERALALGPCRVIPREMPGIRARMVDLSAFDASSEAAARQVVGEAMAQDAADLVAYRQGERFTQELVRDAAPAAGHAKPLVRDGGTYLITGGLGDIALELAGYLASRHRARIALVSRRDVPARSSWAGIAASGDHSASARTVRRLLALEEQGGQVLALRADVADPRAMARVVTECRAHFGSINGVFHTAGVLADGLIASKTEEGIHQVLDPKACGAQVLHELLPPGDLDVFAVFSSTSVFLGSAGQVDYVAANAFLDALAASRADGLAIHWGIWGDKGMAARAHGRDALAQGHPEDAHPLLGTLVDSANGATFEASYSPRHLWVLKEHAVGGRPVLPGTAYIEIARAAMNELHRGASVEIRALSFEEAMVFDAHSSRVVRTELRNADDGYDFLVRSRGPLDEHWLEHARAHVSVFQGSLPAAVPPRGEWRPGEIPQAQAVDFGARWHNIERMQLGARGGAAHIVLGDKFLDDFADYAVHPALTDMAATFGLHLVDAAERRGNLFVPVSIERIRLVAPVPKHTVSRVELKEGSPERFASFDVTLHTPDGLPVASFEGFSLRGVNPDAVSQHDRARTRREPRLADAMLANGIRTEDAPALFERIFQGASRDTVVSSIAIEDLRRAMDAAQPKPARKADAHGESVAARDEGLNPVESTLAEAWRELLGVDEIARDDDFFALGGHSLAAVRLFAKIRKNFSVDLPLATLFQAPTLASLAAVVSSHAGLDTAATQEAPKKAASSNVIPLGNRVWSPLVAICRGKPGRKPLFCVHGAGGNVLNFKVLSDRLGPDQPFYGLQAQGVDGRLPALSTIEEMAAQYVHAIRTVDPVGPYRLAGYSAGGMIALEMAQQLIRDGAKVDLVVMVDTLSPAAAARNPSFLQKLWLMRHWSLRFLLDWPGRRRRGKEMQTQYTLALEKLSRGEPLPPELVEHHLFRNFVTAQAQYRPEIYEGDVVLFKATESEMQYLNAGRTLGWEEHVKGDIRVTDIAGSHFSMMAEPGVSELIEGIRRELDRVDDHLPGAPKTRVA
ncbi:type I polyketide synthase [Caenimonas aquaedulcis]|uniref:SDR family oxidoreductase n=1 Tax=Caenimonas aquaedulcis TaxID=2793270 RepID=A0A931MJ95_9BURK|nr:type I polyketide synthase [Caenimonas aquaedulcis]MBG9390065.1 SDR family oxidoreductase [Caenimonas aquaedulcis]